MNATEYRSAARRTAKLFPALEMNLFHASLGMSSELGELAELICRGGAFDKPIKELQRMELGDFMWYFVLAIETLAPLMQMEADLLWDAKLPVGEDLGNHLLWGSVELQFIDGWNPEFDKEGNPLGGLVTFPQMSLLTASGEFATLVKKRAVYGAHISARQWYNSLLFIGRALSWYMMANPHLSFEIVARINIDKLKARYPDKYSDAAALARADENPATPGASA